MYPVIVYPVPCWCAYVEGDITHMSGVAIASVYAAAHVSALANMAQHRGALVAAWMHDAVCGDYYAGPCFTIALHKVLAVDPHSVDAAFEAFEAFEAFDRQVIQEAAYRDALLADDVARGALHAGLRAMGYTISVRV